MKYETMMLLQQAVERVKLANAEGDPILSAWLEQAEQTLASVPTKDEIRASVEKDWLKRAGTMGYGKPGSATYRKHEAEFFVGAMAAMQAVDPNSERLTDLVPPIWFVNIISGRNVVEVDKK